MLGIYYDLVEFDFKKMKITKNVKTKHHVYNIEKVDDVSFLTGESYGNLELINKKDLICLSRL